MLKFYSVSKKEYDNDVFRAIVIVEEGRHKKDGQMYSEALLTIPGRDWNKMTFGESLSMIQKSVNVRYKQVDSSRETI